MTNNSEHEATSPSGAPPAQPAILIGIDWADSEHAYSARLPDGTILSGSFKQKQPAIEAWIREISAAAPTATLDVCIQTSTGPLINALMEFEHRQQRAKPSKCLRCRGEGTTSRNDLWGHSFSVGSYHPSVNVLCPLALSRQRAVSPSIAPLKDAFQGTRMLGSAFISVYSSPLAVQMTLRILNTNCCLIAKLRVAC